ncbi:zinc finger protein zfp1 [Cystoisospora suis]|uniref:Zinc finger protein zfp1 n=1 Tax=Cystoisospora suis TaxID=483139 RepID=A0A2C6KQA9_9APIC|nr:zinc finger protein zfp1 [Cystoisospora suis]
METTGVEHKRSGGRKRGATLRASASARPSIAHVQQHQQNLAREIFWKTQLCPKIQATGVCSKRDQCSFAHSKDELRPPPDLRCTKWCRRFFQGQVCDDPKCLYAHSKEDLRCNSDQLLTFKTAMCKFHARGLCVSGESCRFAHSLSELRSAVPSDVVEGGTSSPSNCESQKKNASVNSSRGSISTDGDTPAGDLVNPVAELSKALAALDVTVSSSSPHTVGSKVAPVTRLQRAGVSSAKERGKKGGSRKVAVQHDPRKEATRQQSAGRGTQLVSKNVLCGNSADAAGGGVKVVLKEGQEGEVGGRAREAEIHSADLIRKTKDRGVERTDSDTLQLWKPKRPKEERTEKTNEGREPQAQQPVAGARNKRRGTSSSPSISKKVMLAYLVKRATKKHKSARKNRDLFSFRIVTAPRSEDEAHMTPTTGHDISLTSPRGSHTNNTLNPEAAPFVPAQFLQGRAASDGDSCGSDPLLARSAGSSATQSRGFSFVGSETRNTPNALSALIAAVAVSQAQQLERERIAAAAAARGPGLARILEQTLASVSPEGFRLFEMFLRELTAAAASAATSGAGSSILQQNGGHQHHASSTSGVTTTQPFAIAVEAARTAGAACRLVQQQSQGGYMAAEPRRSGFLSTSGRGNTLLQSPPVHACQNDVSTNNSALSSLISALAAVSLTNNQPVAAQQQAAISEELSGFSHRCGRAAPATTGGSLLHQDVNASYRDCLLIASLLSPSLSSNRAMASEFPGKSVTPLLEALGEGSENDGRIDPIPGFQARVGDVSDARENSPLSVLQLKQLQQLLLQRQQGLPSFSSGVAREGQNVNEAFYSPMLCGSDGPVISGTEEALAGFMPTRLPAGQSVTTNTPTSGGGGVGSLWRPAPDVAAQSSPFAWTDDVKAEQGRGILELLAVMTAMSKRTDIRDNSRCGDGTCEFPGARNESPVTGDGADRALSHVDGADGMSVSKVVGAQSASPLDTVSSVMAVTTTEGPAMDISHLDDTSCD